MTKIVQLANFYSTVSGGLRVAVDTLGAGYRERGHSVHLIVAGASTRSTDERTEITAPLLPNGSGYRVIISRRAVLDALEAADPELIEVHDRLLLPWVWKWAAARGVPVIAVSHERLDVTLDALLPRTPLSVRRFVGRIGSRTVLARSDVVVAYSRFAAAEYGPSTRVRLATLGVDLDRFRSLPRSITDWIGLICVSRLAPEKRPDVAIATVAELVRRGYRVDLTILGVGPWEARLREQARGLPVHFGGFLDRERTALALVDADIALVPGPAETFGLAALEALASGTPVVTVAGSGAAELATGYPNAGRTVDLDAVRMADAVLDLMTVAPSIRQTAARAVAENFSWDRAVTSMLDVHAELLWKAPAQRE